MSNTKLTLTSGRTLYLETLRQEHVYAGLLEGCPTREMNQGIVDELRDQARERTGHEPFVIEPVQTPIRIGAPYPFGEPAQMPAIACTADFTSKGRDPLYSTHLTVIWFQDDYAFPLAAQIESTLLALDWDRLAIEVER